MSNKLFEEVTKAQQATDLATKAIEEAYRESYNHGDKEHRLAAALLKQRMEESRALRQEMNTLLDALTDYTE